MPKTSVVSSRLEASQGKRLARKAKQLGRSPSEVSALLIEEGLRRDEFAFIDFRSSVVGRQAYIQGSTLAVWEVVWIAGGYENDAQRTAKHLRMSSLKVQSALNYAAAYPEEIAEAIHEHEGVDLESLRRMVPQAESFPAAVTK